jgi:hypothetical protein
MEKAILNAYHSRYFCDICLDEVNRDGGCLSIYDTRIFMAKKQFKNKWMLKERLYGLDGVAKCNRARLGSTNKTMDTDDEWWKTQLVVSLYVYHLPCLFARCVII